VRSAQSVEWKQVVEESGKAYVPSCRAIVQLKGRQLSEVLLSPWHSEVVVVVGAKKAVWGVCVLVW